MKIPQHVAIILDGNGRWAKSKGMPRNYGHTVGAKNVETVCQAAHDMGIKYLTLYAFSTENWNRPDNEVNALMKLLESYLKNCIKTADKNNMRVRVIGDTTKLSEKFQNQIKELESASAHNDGLNLQIAINYGSRDEMLRGMRKMYADLRDGKLQENETGPLSLAVSSSNNTNTFRLCVPPLLIIMEDALPEALEEPEIIPT